MRIKWKIDLAEEECVVQRRHVKNRCFGLFSEAGQNSLDMISHVTRNVERNGHTGTGTGSSRQGVVVVVAQQRRVLQRSQQEPGEQPNVRDAFQEFAGSVRKIYSLIQERSIHPLNT